jgi:hypothetical protein
VPVEKIRGATMRPARCISLDEKTWRVSFEGSCSVVKPNASDA